MLLEPIRWSNNKIVFIDQTQLPRRLKYESCSNVNALCDAIKRLKIRGAPLIGVAVALGYALSALRSRTSTIDGLKRELRSVARRLKATRPTAVNLFWAIERMENKLDEFLSGGNSLKEIKDRLLKEALRIMKEDRAMCRDIGRNGARVIKNGDVILTHCNAGMLATAGYGTALSVLYHAKKQGKRFKVFVDETRPLMQGARLTMWELIMNGIDATLICDDMAATTMKKRGVTKVIVGADRIARNGDTANKIGTYGLAILARYHKIPFYIAAPASTVDFKINSGDAIPIEERDRRELIYIYNTQTAPLGSGVFNPAFDVTPAGLITAIITESGVYDIKRFRRIRPY